MAEIASCVMNNGDLDEVKKRHVFRRATFLETFHVQHHSQVRNVRFYKINVTLEIKCIENVYISSSQGHLQESIQKLIEL